MASVSADRNGRRAGGLTRTVNAGLVHHQAGRLGRAEALYRKALQKDPDHAEALHLLGVVASQCGKIGQAITLIGRALPQLADLPEAHLDLGNALQQAGRLAEAADRYRRAIALDPDYGMAHCNLARVLNDRGQFEAALASARRGVALIPEFAGAHVNCAVALMGLGHFGEAEAPLRRALDLMPERAATHRDLGRVLTELGRFDEAVASYQRAVPLEPDDFDTHYDLAGALRAQNRLEDAVTSGRQAVMLRPGSAEGHTRLGNLLKALGKPEEAVASHQKALALAPDNPMVHNNLGCALQAQKRLDDAVANYSRALALKPDFADAHNNLGTALQAQYRLDDAAASYQRALALKPDFAEAHNNFGVLLTDLGRLDEAIASYQEALVCVPHSAAIHNNLGNALLAHNRLDDAIASYRRALALDPDYAQAHCNLGEALELEGKPGEAVVSFGRALALKPDHAVALANWFHAKQHVCDWSAYADEPRVRNAVVAEPSLGGPFILLSLWSTPEEQFDCARRVAGAITVPESAVLPHPRPTPRGRIRIGYLSADFHQHATAFLIAGLIEHHDRSGFEVVGYSYGSDDGSAMRARLTAGFDRFVDLSRMPHRQAAEQIHADAVDILIDLKGSTRHSRTAILAHHPAPIQVNYLGYPGTMGADFIDYIIVDPFVVPPDQQPFYSEKLVHLPDCYQCNDDKRVIAEQSLSRIQSGLPKHGFVFCCFNNTYKITPVFFDIWMRLLRAVPASVLWLLGMSPSAKGNLARGAAARGVEPERLVFAPPLPVAKHLARCRLADLFLDTLPVNAHTTASDALWAGLPLLTCAGNTFVGRVAGSLLRAIGLGELVTTSLDEYEALALRLAQEPEALARLRARLAQNRLTHPLFDTARTTGNLEMAYRRMWEIWRAGQPPAAFSVSSASAPNFRLRRRPETESAILTPSSSFPRKRESRAGSIRTAALDPRFRGCNPIPGKN